MRSEFPRSVKVAAFQRSGGRCEKCTAFLYSGRTHYDHVIADGLGGEPTLENCQTLCLNCHDEKTRKHDVPVIAKMKRVRDGHIGAKAKRPWNPGLRKKLNGQTVRRLQ